MYIFVNFCVLTGQFSQRAGFMVLKSQELMQFSLAVKGCDCCVRIKMTDFF